MFEVDPLTCDRCGAELMVVSVITAPGLIDRLLRHVRDAHDDEGFGARAPPAA